jgi:hypothetical protein
MNGLDAYEGQAQGVADILSHHVKLSVEGIDQMYLNVYVPPAADRAGELCSCEGIAASSYRPRPC